MLPPDVLARIEQMVAAAPPLSPAQQRIIRRVVTPPKPAADAA